jgi:outer membrane protein assembly factor BamB
MKPLRLWPGVVIALVVLLARFGLPLVMPEAAMIGVIGGVAGALAIVVWWAFFSRAPWLERLAALGVMVAALFATSRVVHESIATGMMGMMLLILAIPVIAVAMVAAAAATSHVTSGPRFASMAAAILLACGAFTLIRTGGMDGDGRSDLHWRWAQTPEERLLAKSDDPPSVVSPAPDTAAPSRPTPPGDTPSVPASVPAQAAPPATRPADDESSPPSLAASPSGVESHGWPGFRGPGRDGVVHGVRIRTDWAAAPPAELWRRAIGPGWSSFAVGSDLFYTQEQRGDDEVVTAYRIGTGEPVWRHRDAVRFWESNGGAGPRATPTLSHDRVYAFGATGILNALDARRGTLAWSRNVASETRTAVPDWGFSSSPLVVDDVVIVAASGTLAAYDAASGKPRWFGSAHGGSYSSPHRATIGGVAQVLLLSGSGASSVAPESGAVLWEHPWAGGTTIVQPALTADGNILINTIAVTGGYATRRLAVAHDGGGWRVEERWTSNGLKPYFNDFVVHNGHAFGFDGSVLACIDLEDGQRKWKGGRYGYGQLVLLPDQDVLLVLSEEGELALVKATPDQFTELARIPAIEGKTWNHPVLAGDVLLVRNGEEMAAFRLALDR